MSANNNPIYSAVPSVQGNILGIVANTKSTGSGTLGVDMFALFTAGANGSYVQRARFNPVSSVAALAIGNTTLRVFVANIGLGPALTSGSNFLFQEITAATQTADQTITATSYIEIPLNFGIPSGSAIVGSAHVVNNANTGWAGTVFGGNY